MKLSKLVLSNFQCFGEQPEIVELENDISILIGLNGTGKTATLQALSRMFGVSEGSRKVRVEDFHCMSNPEVTQSESLYIEAWFSFPELSNETPEQELTAVAGTFNQLCFAAQNDTLMLRIRLEANLTVDDVSPEGVVNDSVYYILTDSDDFQETQKKELRRSDRNNIQVHYIPASRNPLKEIGSSTKVLLGRLLNAVNWNRDEGGELSVALDFTKKASDKLAENPAIGLIETQLQASWKKMYSGDFLSTAKINFLPMQVDELLKTVSLSFLSDNAGQPATMERLSDGQRSLLHIAIIQAVHELESNILRDQNNRIHFDQSKLKQSIFTLLALEEPENHLAPHFLGRITKSMKLLASAKDAQVIVTTHSPSLVGRVEPTKLRYFHLEATSRKASVLKIPLPDKADELYKYISGAVKAYPEIYFARLVVLGEGESEQAVLPKLLSQSGIDIDDTFVTVAPLGGRHVNHFWRLLNGLKIPHVTLLDLDYGRHGGGWGRFKYAFEQIKEHRPDSGIFDELIQVIPSWDCGLSHPLTAIFTDGTLWKNCLEDRNIFFSAPIDLDYAMQKAFPENYNVTLGQETGPQTKEWGDLKKSVLKKSFSEDLAQYYTEAEHKDGFLWYNYRFLGNKGKPTSHINALENIDFSVQDNIDKIPGSLKTLINRVQTLVKALPE